MVNKKRKITILVIVIIIVGILSSIFTYLYIRYNKTEFEVHMAFSDGFVAKIPIPKGAVHVEETGVGVDKFRTKLSEEEINAFYEDYFSGLKKVHSLNDVNRVGYYDSEQRVVVFDISMYEANGKMYFSLLYDIYDDQYWSK